MKMFILVLLILSHTIPVKQIMIQSMMRVGNSGKSKNNIFLSHSKSKNLGFLTENQRKIKSSGLTKLGLNPITVKFLVRPLVKSHLSPLIHYTCLQKKR